MAIKDDLVFKLRGPHINRWEVSNLVLQNEVGRLQKLCLEAADEIERLRRTSGEAAPSRS